MRKAISEGQKVTVPCIIASGSFPHERFVKIEAEAEPGKISVITAFVPSEFIIRDTNPGSEKSRKGEISLIVSRLSGAKVGLFFPGELLSGSNPAWVNKNWLDKVALGRSLK